MAARISIIVPVYNEAAVIGGTLTALRNRAATAEIIVVDGGSTDGTPDLVRNFGCRVVTSARGRAVQLNKGAEKAHGEVLWFLHADAIVPVQCLDRIARALRDPQCVGGFFRIRLPRRQAIYRLTDGFAHYAGILLRMRCGDHGFFCRRVAFTRAGGFPNVPIMEDVEFFRALRRVGRVVHLKEFLTVSARRYEQVGPVRLTFAYGLIAVLYAMGLPLRYLAAIYSRLCERRI